MLALARYSAAKPRPKGSLLKFYTDYPFLRKEHGWDIFESDQLQEMECIPAKLRQKF